MKKLVISLLGLISYQTIFAQGVNIDSISKAIVAEGKELYRSEMASWYGTDIVVEKFKQQEKLQGYFSYPDGDSTKCIFYFKGPPVKVVAVVTFDSSFQIEKASTNFIERDLTEFEKSLYNIRKKAFEEIDKNKDSIFKFYQNTNYNLIPMIWKGEKRVYVLTGSKKSGVVIFGNDYLLSFDKDGNFLSAKRLHLNIMPIDYGEEKDKDGNKIVGAVHMHLAETGEFMTATDICTLMLYSKMAKWSQHTVVSENYMNIWIADTNVIIAVPRNAIEKINEDQRKKKKKSKD